MNIIFIFDRPMHYHVDLFQTLENELSKKEHKLFLLSGESKINEKGRIGLRKKIIKNEFKYKFREIKIYSYTFRYQKHIIRYIKLIKPSIIILVPHVGNITVWLLGFFKNKYKFKLISWQCGFEYNDNFIKNYILKIFLRLFDYHLAYHTNAKKYLTNHKIPDNNITVIHNTINEKKINLIEKSKAKKILNSLYGIIKDRLIILFVGAVLKEKNLDYLIEAYKRLNRKDVILIIVGDGEYLDELKQKYKDLEIIFTGRIIDEVGIYFDAADIFVLTGTGGLAINEAMAHSLPIISGYADGSADDLVKDNYNGYRLREYSIEELLMYISILIDDPLLRLKFGKNSRNLITNEYSFSNFINRIISGILELK